MSDTTDTTPPTDAIHAQFLRLFLGSEREVLRYITALVPDLSEAQEILQETAVALWARFDQYNPALPFTPWACRFALNTVKQWATRQRKWRTLLENGLAETIAARRESLLPEMNQRMQRLDHCLEKLPPPQREVVQQYYFLRQSIETMPDGGHLALRICNIVLTKSTHPLRKEDFETNRTIQIVTFPGAKLVCEFPAGLGMAFSQDGKRAALSLPEDKAGQQIVEHSAVSGELLRNYEPRIGECAYAIAYSPDGKWLAAYDSAGELLLWNTATGELKRRVHLPNDAPGYLRFSHDSKLIAVSLMKGPSVIDVESGAFVASLRQPISGEIRWASDDKSFNIIRNVGAGSISERADKNGNLFVFNVFPTVQTLKLADLKP